jgi:DNA-binding XRE family transcriptional regulator
MSRSVPAKFTHQACPRCGTPQSRLNGAWLRRVREAAGLTLREFAQRAGVSAAYICDIEHNRRNCLPEMRKNYETFEGFLR